MVVASVLAKLYQCKNDIKNINKAVKRNIERFPAYIFLVKQRRKKIAVPKWNHKYVNKFVTCICKTWFSYTCHNIEIKTATEVSIKIIDVFVLMR